VGQRFVQYINHVLYAQKMGMVVVTSLEATTGSWDYMLPFYIHTSYLRWRMYMSQGHLIKRFWWAWRLRRIKDHVISIKGDDQVEQGSPTWLSLEGWSINIGVW